MKVCYNKLWKLLIDKGMKKSQLRVAVGASNICEYLNCDFGDIMEAVPEIKEQ